MNLGAHGFFIVFDTTDREQFSSISEFIKIIKEEASEEFKKNIIIIGNKTDQTESRKVAYEEGLVFLLYIYIYIYIDFLIYYLIGNGRRIWDILHGNFS